ncbi:hypothetical protein FFY45_12045 [Xanthomonas hortorum]|nr:hypothetical protein [Xanthomonas hortorum]
MTAQDYLLRCFHICGAVRSSALTQPPAHCIDGGNVSRSLSEWSDVWNGSDIDQIAGADQTAAHRTAAPHPLLATMHTDHPDWSLPAHHRGTLRGMDAA